MKQTLKIGAMLLVVAALATTGIALAQSDDEASVFAAAVEAVPEDSPLRARILEWLAPLVEDDTISDEQAAAVADTLAERLPRPGRGIGRVLVGAGEAADFLGLTGPELVEALRDGATLAEIAADLGSSGEALIDHLAGVVEERLDEAVAGGRLSEDEAAERLAQATERITALVNGEFERPFPGGPLGGPGGMGRGHPGRANGPCGDEAGGAGMTDLGA